MTLVCVCVCAAKEDHRWDCFHWLFDLCAHVHVMCMPHVCFCPIDVLRLMSAAALRTSCRAQQAHTHAQHAHHSSKAGAEAIVVISLV